LFTNSPFLVTFMYILSLVVLPARIPLAVSTILLNLSGVWTITTLTFGKRSTLLDKACKHLQQHHNQPASLTPPKHKQK